MKPNPTLEAPLRAVRARMRHVQRTRGLMILATVALGGLLLLMAVDFLLSPLPGALRWVLSGVWLAGVLVAAKIGFGPLFRPIGLLQVARWLEVRHPEIEERLSTVLELSRTGEVPADLLEALTRAAEQDASAVDAAAEVRTSRATRRWARPAVALLALLAMVFAVWPGEASRLLVRAVAPFSDVGNAAAGRFRIAPGDLEMLAGDPLSLEVAYTGAAEALEIRMELESGQVITQPMARTAEGHRYLLDPVREGFSYRAVAGREESDPFTITVWPRPELRDARARLDFPDYTGLAAEEIPLDRGVTAVTGTRVTLSGTLNTAIDSAWLEIEGNRVAEFQPAADGGRLTVSWQLTQKATGTAVVTLKHRLGQEIEGLRFPVAVVEDQPPVVTLLSPMQHELRVRPDELLQLRYEASDDFALAALAVETEPAGRRALDLPPRLGDARPARYRGRAEVAVGALQAEFPGTGKFRLRLRAEDGRPSGEGGPGVGYSEWLTLRVDSGAESLARQELRQQDEGARRTLEEAMRAAREARDRMDWHRGEIRNPELSENARKNLKEAGERLATAEKDLAELARQMEDSVHAARAEEVAKAAELAAKAREDLENALLQDTPDERERSLDQARNEAQEIQQQLERTRAEMDRARPRIEDLARLMDLARQQQELARQAAAEMAEPEADRGDWQNRQRQVEEALRQQLRERPESQSGTLAAQQQEAGRLAAEAREAAAAQEAMAEISPDKLRNELATAQAEIAAAAHEELREAQARRDPRADQLPAATEAADAAKSQLENGAMEDAAASAGKAAAAMKEAARQPAGAGPEPAAQAEDIAALAERQEKLAGALESLAAGEPQAAARMLAESRARDAADLAAEIDRMPLLEGNGAVNEARNAGRQAAGQAEAAASSADAKQAADRHGESGRNFQQAAQALDRAAEDFARAARETAGRQPDARKAPADAAALGEAFHQAAMAASEPAPAAAAQQAAAAAAALAQAAETGRQGLQGKQPGPPGTPLPGRPGRIPGEDPDDPFRLPEADPGVPPELARLGISSEDWAKIRASLQSDVGAADAAAVPAEYRGLVKRYFESMSRPEK